MAKKPIDDLDVWTEYTRLVKPLGQRKLEIIAPPMLENHSDHTTTIASHPKPMHTPTQPNLKNVKIQARIDLHGMTLEKAHERLTQFIFNAHHINHRCVLVITGKGVAKSGEWWQEQGILRLQVPRWLQENPLRSKISTHCIAKPEHGGTGAYYVFLKKKSNV